MKKIVILSVILGIFFGGCAKHNPEEEESLQVVIFISARSISSSLLKSDVTEAETIIQKLIIYGVDENNAVVDTFHVGQQSIEDSSIELTISRKIKTFYAIANPSTEIEEEDPANVTALTNLVADFANAPQSPFLMSGKAELNNYHASIELVRAIAKIQIIGENGFEIQTVTVSNTPDRGYVFDREGALPLGIVRKSYPQADEVIFYVAENIAENTTSFTITGSFEGKNATYNFVLKIDGDNVAILRNTHYKVGISPITEDDCIITVNIPDWIDVDTDPYIIPDEDF